MSSGGGVRGRPRTSFSGTRTSMGSAAPNSPPRMSKAEPTFSFTNGHVNGVMNFSSGSSNLGIDNCTNNNNFSTSTSTSTYDGTTTRLIRALPGSFSSNTHPSPFLNASSNTLNGTGEGERDESREGKEEEQEQGFHSSFVKREIQDPQDPQQQPPSKRRRLLAAPGVIAEKVLYTALDAAIFTSSCAYAAFNMWMGNEQRPDQQPQQIQNHQSHEELLHPDQQQNQHPLEPPLSPNITQRRQPRSSHIPRIRQRKGYIIQQSSASNSNQLDNSSSNNNNPFSLAEFSVHKPLLPAIHNHHQEEEQQHQISPTATLASNDEEDQERGGEGEDEEMDEEWASFSTRLQDLIAFGQNALDSKPNMNELVQQQQQQQQNQKQQSNNSNNHFRSATPTSPRNTNRIRQHTASSSSRYSFSSTTPGNGAGSSSRSATPVNRSYAINNSSASIRGGVSSNASTPTGGGSVPRPRWR